MATKKKASGAVPRDVRRVCREAFADGLPHLARCVTNEGEKITFSERLKALEILGKFGSVEVDAVLLQEEDVAQAAISVVHAMFGPDRLEEFSELLLAELTRAGEATDDH